MAKKKVTNSQDKPAKTQEQIHHHHPTTTAMEEASEKLHSLKSLNAILLKETVERRQQVDSLLQSNGFLESELTHAKMEKKDLQAAFTQLSDRAVLLEIERSLESVFVSVQVNQQKQVIEMERDGVLDDTVQMKEKLESLEREMTRVVNEKSEIEKEKSEKESEIRVLRKKVDEENGVRTQVCRERNAIRAQLDAQIEETNRLKVKLIEAGERKVEIGKEVEKLKLAYDGIVKEKEERGRMVEAVLKEKDVIQRSLVESNRVIDEMKKEAEELVREKKEIEETKNVEEGKKKELENTVDGLNEVVLSLKKEENVLREKVAEMEKRCEDGLEKQMQVGMEIEKLVEEKKEREQSVESLIEEKGLVMKNLDEAMKNLEHQKLLMEQMAGEKMEIEAAKGQAENEVFALKEQLGEYRDSIVSMEESQKEKLKQLESEVSHHRAAFDRAEIEGNKAREGLEEGKIMGKKLREKISEMEKDIAEMHKVLGGMKEEGVKLVTEKNELETRCSMLMKDLGLVEDKLCESRKEFERMKEKVEIADASSRLIFNMLRNTAAICLSKEDENGTLNLTDSCMVVDEEKGGGEEIKQYVVELESIKKTFKNREGKIVDMKRQLEFLQNSAAAAHKGKSFWTLVSSATTILAAASLAYVASGH